MKVYNYDYNGIYIGSSDADQDPENEFQIKMRKKNEPEIKPVFLLPAFATFEAPPKASAGEQAVFVNGKWVLQSIPVTPVKEEEKPEELTNKQKRERELPGFIEYIEAVATGNKIAEKAYLDKVKELLLKYPDA